jgi:hypothetical protein
MSNTIKLLESIQRVLNENDNIKKKEEEYLDYINTHKANVEKAWDIIKEFDNPYIQNNLYDLDRNIKDHDNSKYDDEEFEYYRKKYFPINDDEANEVMDKIQDIFWLHYSKNPHHWEYWLDENKELDYTKHNEDNIDNAIMMAYIEMFCDWASFGLKQDNPREVRSWYINEKPKMTLFPAEQEVLEDILEEYISKFPEEDK